MKSVDALPGVTIKFEEGEFYAFASVNLDGEGYSVRIPLGDGRYHAETVMQRIVAPAIAPRKLDPVDFSEI